MLILALTPVMPMMIIRTPFIRHCLGEGNPVFVNVGLTPMAMCRDLCLDSVDGGRAHVLGTRIRCETADPGCDGMVAKGVMASFLVAHIFFFLTRTVEEGGRRGKELKEGKKSWDEISSVSL